MNNLLLIEKQEYNINDITVDKLPIHTAVFIR
jgi:hypothetical protein